MQIVNGMTGQEGPKYANGCGCLAAQMVAHFKTGRGGQFYLCPPGNRQLYTYIITTKSKQPANLRVEYHLYQKPVQVVYDGPISGFDPEMEIPDDEDA